MAQATSHATEIPQDADSRQLQWLRTLHGGLASDFGEALSALLRGPVDVELVGVDRRTYGEFLDHLGVPACFYVLKDAAIEERLMLDIEPSILYPMIDRLLGGSGENVPLDRPPTEIELRLAARTVGLFLQELRRAWRSVYDLNLDVLQVESNPRLLRVLPSDEMVVLVGLELTIGDSRGLMCLCLPCRILERIGDQRPPEDPAVLEDALLGSLVEIGVTLAETQIAADALADLRVGDIIATETAAGDPAVASMMVDGVVRKFHAKPGAYQGHKAICITTAIEENPASERDELHKIMKN